MTCEHAYMNSIWILRRLLQWDGHSNLATELAFEAHGSGNLQFVARTRRKTIASGGASASSICCSLVCKSSFSHARDVLPPASSTGGTVAVRGRFSGRRSV